MLTTVEAALAGGVLLAARDGALRDMASMHGSYRKVGETRPALELLGQHAGPAGRRRGRLAAGSPGLQQRPAEADHGGLAADQRLALAGRAGGRSRPACWPTSPEIVATADSAILDRCRPWFNLAQPVRSPAACPGPGSWTCRKSRTLALGWGCRECYMRAQEGGMNDHKNKHIREAVNYAMDRGWRRVTGGPRRHIWGTLYCPHADRDGCFWKGVLYPPGCRRITPERFAWRLTAVRTS